MAILEEKKTRSYEEIMSDILRLHKEYREKIQHGFENPDEFMKLSEIERLGQELNFGSQKFSLEETNALLANIDQDMLLRKKKLSFNSEE